MRPVRCFRRRCDPCFVYLDVRPLWKPEWRFPECGSTAITLPFRRVSDLHSPERVFCPELLLSPQSIPVALGLTHWPSVCVMLGQRRRPCPNITQTEVQIMCHVSQCVTLARVQNKNQFWQRLRGYLIRTLHHYQLISQWWSIVSQKFRPMVNPSKVTNTHSTLKKLWYFFWDFYRKS